MHHATTRTARETAGRSPSVKGKIIIISDMKHAKILFCLFIALSLAIPRSIHAQSYASLWKKVAQLRDKDLPQSAAKQAHKIYTLASQRNDD